MLELNPCTEPGAWPHRDNYNHLSVPDPATACGNLLYRARGGRKRKKEGKGTDDGAKVSSKKSQDLAIFPKWGWGGLLNPKLYLDYLGGSIIIQGKRREEGKGMDDRSVFQGFGVHRKG